MKKLLAMLLLASMLVTLSACKKVEGDPTQSDSQHAVSSKDDSSVPEASQSSDDETENKDDSSAPETSQSDDDDTETKDDSSASETSQGGDDDTEAKDILGSYSEDTYTYVNNFIGIGCRLNDDWDVFDAEQIAVANGIALSQVTNKGLAEQLQKNGLVLSFGAQNHEGTSSLNVSLENLGLLYGLLLNEQQYAEKGAMQIPSALESAGATDVTATVDTISFAGSDHVAIRVSGSMLGMPLYETMVCVKVDIYMVLISATSLLTDVTEETLSAFYSP